MSRRDHQQHHRRSIRYPGYDYSQSGAYFTTICVRDRECLLGSTEGDDVLLSPLGEMALSAWQCLPEYYPQVELDAFVVMPNHVHGILALDAGPTPEDVTAGPRPSLAHVIARYKSLTTRAYWRIASFAEGTAAGRLWQRNYYERIIRNERELDAIREYIALNPAHWPQDPDNRR